MSQSCNTSLHHSVEVLGSMHLSTRSPFSSSGVPGANILEKYPLVVAMTDGRVQRVCSHPDDDTWAINMKKGVASALQVSLPSLSTTNSGLNLTEVT